LRAGASTIDGRSIAFLRSLAEKLITRSIDEPSRCRRLDASINERETASKIEALAVDYERRAAAISASMEAKQARMTANPDWKHQAVQQVRCRSGED